MADALEEVRGHYQEDVDEGARLTAGPGPLELARTQEIVRRHLPPAGPDSGDPDSGDPGGRALRILDVGGGTGVHAAWLADDGHRVHVVDVVPRHVEQVQALATSQRAITAELGDARDLRAGDTSVDAVLLLGPLYHLTERDDRVRALAEARRVVRPGGPIFVAAISRFASLLDGLQRGFVFDPDFRRIVERDLREGQHRNPDRRPHWFTTAYFHHPDELPREAEAAGLEVVEVLGVEGAGWLAGPALDRWDDPAVRETILFAARATESEPALRAASPHLLMVTRRPRATS
jgi:ubiquinone/menaquinone biosynthesis C-methylase UbiE